MWSSSLRKASIAVVTAIFSGAWGCTPAEGTAGPVAPVATPVAAPPCAGRYTDGQLALVEAPVETPVAHPAGRVCPDLSKFTFLGESPLRIPEDPEGYAAQVDYAIESSPLLYVFQSGPEGISNAEALWGEAPADAPDPWKRSDLGGSSPGLVPSVPSADECQRLDLAMAGSPEDALSMASDVSAAHPEIPGVHVLVADSALVLGDYETAEREANAALDIDRRFPHAHRVLAEVHLRRKDIPKAKREIARSLAAYPTYARAWQVAETMMKRALDRPVAVPAPFIDTQSQGAVLVVSCDRAICRGYAACKAAFRYVPSFRSAVLHEPANVPYHLSVTEEVVCLGAGLGTHLAAHDPGAHGGTCADTLCYPTAASGLSHRGPARL